MPFQEITSENERELSGVADLLAKSHKILLITGAGISTSCGIPDFRSKDGLYSLIPRFAETPANSPTPPPSRPLPSTPRKRKFRDEDDMSLPFSSQASDDYVASQRLSETPKRLKGKDLFDARLWKDTNTTSIFYRFIASLRQKIREEVVETSKTHKLIRTLRDGGRLMRCYTQNIDGLEGREGLVMDLAGGKGNKRRFMKKVYQAPRPPTILTGDDMDGGCEVVPLHGDLDHLRCNLCNAKLGWTDEDTESFLEGRAPSCPSCQAKSHERQTKGKRGVSIGSLRPNVVLYNEAHPFEHLLAPLPSFDISQNPEVLVIMGTSLTVHGLQKLTREFAKAVHSRKSRGRVIFINRTRPAGIWNEYIDDWVSMNCDDWVQDLTSRREDIWLRQGELALPVTKPGKVAGATRRKSGKVSNKSQSMSSNMENLHLSKDERSKLEVKISVTLPKQGQASKDTVQRMSTPDVDQQECIRVLPTPPASRGKSKSSKTTTHGPSVRLLLNTPWREDLLDSPSKRRKIDIHVDESSPPYEKIKEVKSPVKRGVLTPLPLSVDNASVRCPAQVKGNTTSYE